MGDEHCNISAFYGISWADIAIVATYSITISYRDMLQISLVPDYCRIRILSNSCNLVATMFQRFLTCFSLSGSVFDHMSIDQA